MSERRIYNNIILLYYITISLGVYYCYYINKLTIVSAQLKFPPIYDTVHEHVTVAPRERWLIIFFNFLPEEYNRIVLKIVSVQIIFRRHYSLSHFFQFTSFDEIFFHYSAINYGVRLL